MNELGRLMMLIGGLLLLVGFVAMLLPSSLPKLPGDIYVKRQGFVFYFPIVTSILVSVILTVVFTLLSKK